MSEKAMWSTMRVKMAQGHHWREATRHEDKLAKGIADVSFVSEDARHGWMELKQVDEWPKRESTIVRVEHFTTDQLHWLQRKGKAGGNTWLFMKVERDWLLFYWNQIELIGQINRADLERAATCVWRGRMNWSELGAALRQSWILDDQGHS